MIKHLQHCIGIYGLTMVIIFHNSTLGLALLNHMLSERGNYHI